MMSNSSDGKNNSRLILVTILILFFVMGFILLSRALDREYAQSLATILVGLVVVLVIIGILKGDAKATIKGFGTMVSLTGGAAFYWLMLPQLISATRPTVSVQGTLVYEKNNSSGGGFTGVPGFTVKIQNTQYQSDPTKENGQFIILSVPSHRANENLVAMDGEVIHTIDQNHKTVDQKEYKGYPDTFYPLPRPKDMKCREIIPKPQSLPVSGRRVIARIVLVNIKRLL